MKHGVVVTWRGGTTKFHEPEGIESRALRLAKKRGITLSEAVRLIEHSLTRSEQEEERDWMRLT